MIKAGIIGGTGYTGGELIRLLLNHPNVELSFVTSYSNVGKKVTDLHQDLIGEIDLEFIDNSTDADVLFLALPHKESKIWLENNNAVSYTHLDVYKRQILFLFQSLHKMISFGTVVKVV